MDQNSPKRGITTDGPPLRILEAYSGVQHDQGLEPGELQDLRKSLVEKCGSLEQAFEPQCVKQDFPPRL